MTKVKFQIEKKTKQEVEFELPFYFAKEGCVFKFTESGGMYINKSGTKIDAQLHSLEIWYDSECHPIEESEFNEWRDKALEKIKSI